MIIGITLTLDDKARPDEVAAALRLAGVRAAASIMGGGIPDVDEQRQLGFSELACEQSAELNRYE
jgi:hypothetical protein